MASTGTSGTATGSSGAAPAATAASSSGGSAPTLPTVSAARIKSAASGAFTMPPGTVLAALTGQNWNVWSGTLIAFLQLNEVDPILYHTAVPSGVDSDDWDSVQKKTKAYLRLYCAADVFSIIESDTDFPTFKDKYDRLKDAYGGVGSTAVFNLWIELTQARLDDSSPLLPS